MCAFAYRNPSICKHVRLELFETFGLLLLARLDHAVVFALKLGLFSIIKISNRTTNFNEVRFSICCFFVSDLVYLLFNLVKLNGM